MNRSRMPQVAVVGAGIAGLAAARTLQAQGCQVQVFDKGRRVGGRTCARVVGPVAFDHGAQYFTVRDPRFRVLVEACLAAGTVQPWEGRVVALNPDGLSESDSQTRYVGVPAMHALADHLARDVSVQSSTRITRMRKQGGEWQLLDEHDAAHAVCDAVVLAVPAAQALDLLEPGSPLAPRLAGCRFAPCWAVMAQFDGPLPLDFDGAFVNASPLAWIARNNAKPGRPEGECWVLHAGADWTRDHLEDEAPAVAEALMTTFRDVLHERLGEIPPAPQSMRAHRWRYALPIEPLDEGFLHDEDADLIVCGDYCNGARIEGAYLSGVKAAERLTMAEGPTNSPRGS